MPEFEFAQSQYYKIRKLVVVDLDRSFEVVHRSKLAHLWGDLPSERHSHEPAELFVGMYAPETLVRSHNRAPYFQIANNLLRNRLG